MSRNCNGCDSLFVDWYEPVIGKSYCEDCAEERNYAGMIETANSLSEALDCLVEASAALTRYRILTQGTRPFFEDLTIYEWLTSLVPDRAIKDTPEQVMHRVITEHKYLWAPSAYADHWAQGEIDRVSELLDELGYGVDELSDDEPTCDVCGKHTEDAVWCGSCGCCREHCAGFADCDEEDS